MSDRIPCPNCAEQIIPTARVCRFCQSKLTPQFVKDPKANKQIVAIETLRTKGQSSEKIAAFLKSKNQRYLADDSDWTAEKVDQIIKQFIERGDVPQEQPQPQQKGPKKKRGLTKCKDCGQEISKKAKTCPHCGAKAPKRTSLFAWLVLFVGLYVLYAAATNHTPKSSSTTVQKSQSNNSIKATESYPVHATYDVSTLRTKDLKLIAWADRAKDEVKKRLKDPDSAKFGKVYVHQTQKNVWIVCGFVNAKNSFGGYTGEKQFVSGVVKGTTFLESEVKKDWYKVWNSSCATKG